MQGKDLLLLPLPRSRWCSAREPAGSQAGAGGTHGCASSPLPHPTQRAQPGCWHVPTARLILLPELPAQGRRARHRSSAAAPLAPSSVGNAHLHAGL